MSDLEKYESKSNFELEHLISKNDINAMREMAWRWKSGEKGLEVSLEKAFDIYTKAAELGCAASQFFLGEAYSFGEGVESDDDKAFFWYKKSAESDDEGGMFGLACCYYDGAGTNEDKETAFKWFVKSAETGCEEANWWVAHIYENGMGAKKDEEKAFYWYKKSADYGDMKGMFGLGTYYLLGVGTDKDYEKAFNWLSKSAEEGYDAAFFSLGMMYLAGMGMEINNEQAFYWFEKSAESGNKSGMFELGKCYFNGMGTQQNFTKALKLFLEVEEEGEDNEALQRYLGMIYEGGEGIPTNLDLSLKHYMKAIDENSLFVLLRIAVVLKAQGKNEEAFEWLLKSANLGNADAMFDLSGAYWQGIGCEKDIHLSVEWAEKSANNGNKNALSLVESGNFLIGHSYLMVGRAGGAEDAIKYLNKSREWLYKANQEGLYSEDEFDKNESQINMDLGESFYLLGNKEEAFKYYSNTQNPNGIVMTIMLLMNGFKACNTTLSEAERFLALYNIVTTDSFEMLEDWRKSFSHHLLGLMYLGGLGTKQDYNNAYKHFSKADELGCEISANELKRFKKKLFGGYDYQ